MRNFAALLVIALLAIVTLIFVTNPDLLSKVWLYILGFIGYVMVLVEKGIKSIGNAFKKEPVAPPTPIPISPLPAAASLPVQQTVVNSDKAKLEQKIIELELKLQNASSDSGESLGKTTLTVLRYVNDSETTLGLIFLRNKFFAYTLEDTFREEKVKGKTRIPEGLYEVGFSPVDPADSRITRDYLAKYPWFTKHIHLKNVPGFEGIYIHVGNTHDDTAGCILIADGVNMDVRKALMHSARAYERFYKIMAALLDSNEKATIQVLDENWFERSKLTQI